MVTLWVAAWIENGDEKIPQITRIKSRFLPMVSLPVTVFLLDESIR
jgi:hypothetical protein